LPRHPPGIFLRWVRNDEIRGLNPPVGPARGRAGGGDELEEHHQIPGGIDGISRDRYRVAVSVDAHVDAIERQGLVGDPVVAVDGGQGRALGRAPGDGGTDLDAEDQVAAGRGVRGRDEEYLGRIGMDVAAREKRGGGGRRFRLLGDKSIDGGQVALDDRQVILPVAAMALLATTEYQIFGVDAVRRRGERRPVIPALRQQIAGGRQALAFSGLAKQR